MKSCFGFLIMALIVSSRLPFNDLTFVSERDKWVMFWDMNPLVASEMYWRIASEYANALKQQMLDEKEVDREISTAYWDANIGRSIALEKFGIEGREHELADCDRAELLQWITEWSLDGRRHAW